MFDDSDNYHDDSGGALDESRASDDDGGPSDVKPENWAESFALCNPGRSNTLEREMERGLNRELSAEFLGTFVLILFGVGVNAQVTLGGGNTGDYFSINVGWGLAVTLAVYVAGGVSGAHLNPAVTLAFACLRGFDWRKVLPYMVAQVAGAFVASALVYACYYDALQHLDDGVRQIPGLTAAAEQATAGIWATYPQDYLSLTGGFVDQVVGTAMLLLMIFALTDEKNLAPQMNLGPVIVGGIVFMVGMSFGLNCGYAINPARDFGPRLFTAVAGWGSGVFTAHENWWWVPIAGPLVGGVVGGWVYDQFIHRFHSQQAIDSNVGDHQ